MKKWMTLCLCLSFTLSAAAFAACKQESSDVTPPDSSVEELPVEPSLPPADEETTPPTPEESVPSVTGYVYCTGNGVNIRNGASTSATVVGSAYLGDKLSLVEKGSKWNKILHDGKVAYVSAAYCSSSPVQSQPVTTYDQFVRCTGDSVNIRASASTSASVLGAAKSGKYYALVGQTNGFYKIKYRYGYGYISTSYAVKAQMEKSKDERVEKVLAAAYETIGTPYVYGATRLHGGTGTLFANFNKHAMDCSSLAQYAMYTGAGICIGMNTATQQSEGTLVTGELRRGDLLFFSSESYINQSLPYKIRHVGIYLGNDYMLHTANTKNNAEIVRLSDTGYWWRYFVLARRHF